MLRAAPSTVSPTHGRLFRWAATMTHSSRKGCQRCSQVMMTYRPLQGFSIEHDMHQGIRPRLLTPARDRATKHQNCATWAGWPAVLPRPWEMGGANRDPDAEGGPLDRDLARVWSCPLAGGRPLRPAARALGILCHSRRFRTGIASHAVQGRYGHHRADRDALCGAGHSRLGIAGD